MITLKGKYTTADVMIDDIDEKVISQIYTFINNVAFPNPVKIMPDTHVGKGAVIGFTMPIAFNIVPFVVGVDISCGMLMVRLDKSVLKDIDLSTLDKNIRSRVPMGADIHTSPRLNMKKDFLWDKVQKEVAIFTKAFNNRFETNHFCPIINYDWFVSLCQRVAIRKRKDSFTEYVVNSIGTLGGGK